MTDHVTHRGEITAIDGHDVTLRIHDGERCGDCRLADLCAQTDTRGSITVQVDSTRQLHVGMAVKVAVSERSQGIAIIWSLIMPLVIFLALLMPLSASSMARWAVVLVAVAGVGLYDLLLWRFGPKLSRSIRWIIIPE